MFAELAEPLGEEDALPVVPPVLVFVAVLSEPQAAREAATASAPAPTAALRTIERCWWSFTAEVPSIHRISACAVIDEAREPR
jgi:hypothetical protein